jgi:PAS domain S-box-containing protein
MNRREGNMQTQKTITDHELAEHLHSARSEIFKDWSDRLRHCFGAAADCKMADADACRQNGEDLLGLLLISLKDRVRISELSINPLSEKIRRIDYSISDYYNEASCLEQTLDGFLRSHESLTDRQILDATAMVRQRLNGITARILNECSQIYEYIVETSKACFCHTDLQGRIVFANREMERLVGEGRLVGKRLEDYFSEADRNIVRDAITCSDGDGPGIVRLTVVSAQGRRIVVHAEIGPLIIDYRNIGGYVHITDISIAEKQHKQLYDRALLGIAKVNRKGEILFANRSLLQMLNTQEYQGVNVFDLLPDEASRQWVASQLESRSGWKSDEYPLDLLRFGDHETVPVMVSAFPETDLSGKRAVGSFAIIRSVMAQRMRHLIESHHSAKPLNATTRTINGSC